MKRLLHFAALLTIVAAPLRVLGTDEPIRSGPPLGDRPKPFSVISVTGPKRGQTHCYVCEAEDRPIVIVFARSINAPLTSLIRKLDEALATHRSADLRSWVVFLSESRGALEAKIEQLAQQHSIATLPLTMVEDRDGPPSYRIHRDAEVTVLFSVKQKVVASYAFKANELTDAKVSEVIASLSTSILKD